jgi:predicted nucleic acid-binding protein
MYLLDTNIVSELRKPKPHGAVLAWIEAIPDSSLAISAVTIGEIQAGIEMTKEQDQEKAILLGMWLDQVAESFNVLPMNAKTFRLWGKIMHRQTNTVIEDAMIAATAIENGLTVVTRNEKDFKRFMIPIFNPFND